jgi:hypothetical protein
MLATLPQELIRHVLSYLDLKTRKVAARTCRVVNKVEHDQVWYRDAYKTLADDYSRQRAPAGQPWERLCQHALESKRLREERAPKPHPFGIDVSRYTEAELIAIEMQLFNATEWD